MSNKEKCVLCGKVGICLNVNGNRVCKECEKDITKESNKKPLYEEAFFDINQYKKPNQD